ncbi:MAG: hypothetical protein JW976_08015 [Syntrophaceae bacterium]|nr:hypothetical protein [Syntrophaceae bacterium]
MASHVFITAKYLDRCIETSLFGVTVQQVNYLAAISPGDTAFLLETGTGRIAGPFFIRAPLFFSQTPVWERSDDKFTYRLRLTGSEVWQADVSALWNVLLRRRVADFFGFTTFQRSSVGLIGDEGRALTDEIKRTAVRNLNLGSLSIDEQQIDLLQRDTKIFASEARLEASLLLAKDKLLELLKDENLLPRNVSLTILNQVTLPGLNYNIDILLLSETLVVVIELKKDKIDENAISQLKRYKRYWDVCGLAVTLIAIGSSDNSTDSSVAVYSYTIERSHKRLCLERKGRRWYLPVRAGD